MSLFRGGFYADMRIEDRSRTVISRDGRKLWISGRQEKEMDNLFKPIELRVNHQRMDAGWERRNVVEGPKIVLSWGAADDTAGARQSAYRITLSCRGEKLFDSDWTKTGEQCCEVNVPLPKGPGIDWTLVLTDNFGNVSQEAEQTFFVGDVDWTAPWIGPSWDDPQRPAYFRKRFTVSKPVRDARLYICGLGYFELTINGCFLGPDCLDPAFTDYTKTCQYVLFPALDLIKTGRNMIEVTVAAGWRSNGGRYLRNCEKPAFFGPLQLSALLAIEYEDGTSETIQTGADWECARGPIVFSQLFDGETFDARRKRKRFGPVKTVPAPGGVMRPMTLPPIRWQDPMEPVSVSRIEDGWLLDFGKNIAGVLRLYWKDKLTPGQTVTLRHAERLNADGTPYFDNLRGAKAMDTYIAGGSEDGESPICYWQPSFTYHGFRYVLMDGISPCECDVSAVPLRTDLKSVGSFRCGSAVLNAIQDMVELTERDNMHSILTDCPQRDERMGWMNDATVRFEETPYNFDAAAMFKKLCRDIADAQGPDGAISCTAPMIYGNRPADPVCSSFLIAGYMAYLHSGDLSVIREQFDAYARWEECLLAHSDGLIVNYSYYGDWAAPAYACLSMENAKSAVTPGEFMSTGYSYYNCTLLARFSRLLGKTEEELRYSKLAEDILIAMRKKWYDSENKRFATGSMACQTFALWLNIAPEEDRAAMAGALRDDLVRSGCRFTTGNLCTKYLPEVLTRYGYVDEAYELLTREEYPSWGWMLQNEATTVWERFEYKDAGGMNSYCHPMYGAVGAWFYADLAGLRPLEDGWKRFSVKPHLPEKLMSCRAVLRTPRGEINLRWIKRDGKAHLQLDVPFGARAEVTFGGQESVCESGHHIFSYQLNERG